MLVRDSGYHWMVDTVGIAAVFTVTSSMVRAANDKCVAPCVFPAVQQATKLSVHVAQRGSVGEEAVLSGSLQVEVVGIMDGVHV